MDKILLETSFYWLSDDVVRFKIDVGFYEKFANTATMALKMTIALVN